MGQEERRNKAKLEKTQITLATSNTEYEAAIKALEETTVRWNREWKAAADKFQDLEEERLDFTKSSLWTFANIASTVCVSDDASCEKIRLSLENMEVEKDITSFITDRGTGQEIPDAPKYINFRRGDLNDAQSDVSDDDHYSVAQFPRSINPAFRSSSPQPSTFESHHDPASMLANDLAHREMMHPGSRETTVTPQRGTPNQGRPSVDEQRRRAPTLPDEEHRRGSAVAEEQYRRGSAVAEEQYRRGSAVAEEQYRRAAPPVEEQYRRAAPPADEQYRRAPPQIGGQQYDNEHHGPLASVPHDPYPMDGMTMLCRTGPPSDLSSQVTSARPSSRDSRSEYSNPNSFSSVEPPSGKTSPIKQNPEPVASPEKRVFKKKSGFFQNHSPFRRKSTREANPEPNRNTWHPTGGSGSPRTNAPAPRAQSPEPIDANASLALGVGQNVLPVSTSDTRRRGSNAQGASVDETDPIAAALAELKVGGNKASSVRMSADRYHGVATPAPGNHDAPASIRGTPPSYNTQSQVSRLGVPPPAVTSRAMKEASKKVASQTRSVYGDNDRDGGISPSSRPGTRGRDMPRSASPAPTRAASPQPRMSTDARYRSASPNPYAGHQRGASQVRSQDPYRHASPHGSMRGSVRGSSPASYADYGGRPHSSYGGSDMAVQLAPAGGDMYDSKRGRGGDSRAMGLYEGGSRPRSKSVVDASRQYTRDGRVILHFGRSCLKQ